MFFDRPNEAALDPAVRKLVVEQMSQWSEVVERQQREKWETLRLQLKDNQDVLRKLMEGVQAAQMKQLEAKHERYFCSLLEFFFLEFDLCYLQGHQRAEFVAGAHLGGNGSGSGQRQNSQDQKRQGPKVARKKAEQYQKVHG